jgi:UDP-GlcNAc:undecaprenyl-phosphate GlcNAc-1-phosphate transferase
MHYFINLFLSLIIVIILIPFFIKLGKKLHYVDVPGARKVHERPITVLGGLAMVTGVLAVVFLRIEITPAIKGYILGVLILLIFGMLDDYYHFRAREKFMGQVLAALSAMFIGGVHIEAFGDIHTGIIHLGLFSFPVTLFLIVGMTNAINLADGLDGLAAGLCLITFSCIAYMAHLFGEINIAAVSVAVIGASLGFLRYNTYPAIIFMGDTGSQFLGFSAAVLSIMLVQRQTEILSSVLPILILGFPIIDTAMVMLDRIMQKRPICVADKNHFHHKLLQFGFYQKEAVIIIYAFQAILVSSAFIFRFYSDAFLLTGFCVFAAVIIFTFLYLKRHEITVESFRGVRSKIFNSKTETLISRYSIANKVFRILLIAMPVTLLTSSVTSISVPSDVGIICIAILIFTGVLLWLKNSWAYTMIEFATYYIGAFFIYTFEVKEASIDFLNHSFTLNGMVNAFFAVIALLFVVYMVSNTKAGELQITPLHFLILFMLLVVPNLPEYHIQQYHLGPVTAKITILLFAYDILFRRLGNRLTFLYLATVGAIVLLISREGIRLLSG